MDAPRHHHRRGSGWNMDFHMRHRIRQLKNNRFVVEEKQEHLWKIVYKCNHRGLFGYCEAERWIKTKEK